MYVYIVHFLNIVLLLLCFFLRLGYVTNIVWCDLSLKRMYLCALCINDCDIILIDTDNDVTNSKLIN